VTATTEGLMCRYFELAADPDTAAYFAQFADDATVEDEGKERHGIEAIRAWRSEVPLVSYTVLGIQPGDGGWDATVDIAGDFPGSPVCLTFRFEFDERERIRTLTIRP